MRAHYETTTKFCILIKLDVAIFYTVNLLLGRRKITLMLTNAKARSVYGS